MTEPSPIGRRQWLCGLGATALSLTTGQAHSQTPPAPFDPARPPPSAARPAGTVAPPQTSHLPFGRVRPELPVPNVPVTLDDGRTAQLRTLLAGRLTVMQLMFTGCSATCPIQGALFAEVARRNPHQGVRLLSLSIDALGDSPASLKAWMTRFGPHPTWRAAVPDTTGVDTVITFVRGRLQGPDPHTAKVYFFDRRSRLIYKTNDLPSVGDIIGVIGEALAAG
jgi:protein SCO1